MIIFVNDKNKNLRTSTLVASTTNQVYTLHNLMSQFMASASNVPLTFGLGDADKAEITVKFPIGVVVKKVCI